MAALHTVAGNHSRFLFDFSPDAVVFRVSDDPAPRLLYCFETPDDGRTVEVPQLDRRVDEDDIKPGELIFGGSIIRSQTVQKLRERGASVPESGGVLAAVNARKFSALTPQEVADAVVFAARNEHNCCPDLVELRPLGSA